MLQGWECPKCGRVYAPSVAMCWYCPPIKATASSNTGVSLAMCQCVSCQAYRTGTSGKG